MTSSFPTFTTYGVPSRPAIHSDDPEGALGSQIPEFDIPAKSSYLKYRALYFDHHEACTLARVLESTVDAWSKADERFRVWAQEGITRLQEQASTKLVWAQFMRNVTMTMMGDARVLSKYQAGDPVDEDLLRDAAKRYSPQALAAVARVIGPPQTREETMTHGAGQVVVQVQVNNEVVQDRHAQEAAADELLASFRRKAVVIDQDGQVIEG